jgi:hypothetical protein
MQEKNACDFVCYSLLHILPEEEVELRGWIKSSVVVPTEVELAVGAPALPNCIISNFTYVLHPFKLNVCSLQALLLQENTCGARPHFFLSSDAKGQQS